MGEDITLDLSFEREKVNFPEISCSISFCINFQIVLGRWIAIFDGKYCSTFISGKQIKSAFTLVRYILLFRKQEHSYFKERGLFSCCASSFSVLSTSAIILNFCVNGFTSSNISCNLAMRLVSHVEFLEMLRSVASVVSII